MRQLILMVMVLPYSLLILSVEADPTLTSVPSEPAKRLVRAKGCGFCKEVAALVLQGCCEFCCGIGKPEEKACRIGAGEKLFRGGVTLGVPTVTEQLTGVCIWGTFKLVFLANGYYKLSQA